MNHDEWDKSNIEYVTLPDGTVLEDCFIWKDFMQNQLDMDPFEFWNNLNEIPTWDNDREITFDEKGDNVHWIEGGHKALNYRGHAIKRHKIWCQSGYKNGMRKYGYTGWQHAISFATKNYRKVVGMKEFADKLNAGLEQKHNHWIITKYKNEKDNIGFHSDKDKDFAQDSYVVVVKLGEPRRFEFRFKDQKPFWSEILSAGTAVFMRAKASDGTDANSLIQHGVPAMDTPMGLSGSIVSRCITTLIPWDVVKKNVVKAKKNKKGEFEN